MEFLFGIFLIVLFLGALAGGKSFGGTIRTGCGCLILIVIGLAVLGYMSSR